VQTNVETLNNIVSDKSTKIVDLEKELIEMTRNTQDDLNKANLENHNKVCYCLVMKLKEGRKEGRKKERRGKERNEKRN